ncbi:MAG: hypothetical protein AAGF11_04125 [Myxococcota bacterium]
MEGRHEAAATEYQVLTDLDPDDVKASLKLAHHLVEAGHPARAADEYLRLAGIYVRLGHPRRAMTVALRALRVESSRVVRVRLAPLMAGLGPMAAALCEQVSRVHILSGRPEQARDVLGLLVHSEPTALPRRLRLAELDLAKGRTTEAMAELRVVADGLRARGRTQDLLRVLEMMHAHGGPDEAVLRELATIYLRCGQPRRAQRKLEVLHRVAPRDRVTVERLARVHATFGRLESTLRLLGRLVTLAESQADRDELRAVLRRAASWCSDASYQRALDDLGIWAARPKAARRADYRLGRGASTRHARGRRGAVPPPLPRWMRLRTKAATASGEIKVLDDQVPTLGDLDPRFEEREERVDNTLELINEALELTDDALELIDGAIPRSRARSGARSGAQSGAVGCPA